MADQESEKTRVDRELIEFLNELRLALPGVQVLLAFLLIVPFSERFATLDAAQKRVYLTAVITSALSSVLLIAPAVQHRLRFRRVDKAQLIAVSTVFAVVGTALLAVAIGASVHLVTGFIFAARAAAVVAAMVTGVAVLTWFVTPLFYRGSPHRD
ncbi:MAG TPA: DUF6328 family protein [Mycobacteriales bacterium]|nr:DUF6328 family protein [Mycobacteriales bacterium]